MQGDRSAQVEPALRGPQKAERDRALVERMVGLSRENPRYGYRRVWALLRREGWLVNKKRVHRLWREEGLKVPGGKQQKRRRLAGRRSENGCTRRRAEHKDHVWSYDFVMDETEDGRRLKMMPVVDEYTRECLSHRGRAVHHRRGRDRHPGIACSSERGEPAYIRSDNGPEFIAKAVKRWLEAREVETLYIEPGSPWENAYAETFISRLRGRVAKEGGIRRACWKRRCWWRITASTTTTGGRTALWATGPRRSSRRYAGPQSVDAGIVKELQSATALS